MPLISILIPTYNRASYLKECLKSILTLNGFKELDIEIIVSDNCSTDNTEEIVKNLNNENIFYYKNIENIGSYQNVIKVFKLKRGKYFIFVSDDDKFYNKNSLKILYDNLIKYKLDACYGITECFNEKNKYTLKTHLNKVKYNIYYDIFKKEVKYNTMCFGGMLYKNVGINYDINAQEYLDWDYNLQYLKKGYKIGFINNKTFSYRVHENQDSNKINYKSYYLTIYIYKKYKIWKYYPFIYIIWIIGGFLLKISKKYGYFNNIYTYLSKIWRKYM